jgi:acyl carrier protein
MNDIRAVVREFILTQCLPGESPENLRDDTPLQGTGILDSMKTLKLVSVIEETEGVSVEAHEVDEDNFQSVDNIVAFVEGKRAAR